jgi:hypothetical protein
MFEFCKHFKLLFDNAKSRMTLSRMTLMFNNNNNRTFYNNILLTHGYHFADFNFDQHYSTECHSPES